MRIALTGGTGFIGRYIIRELLNHGHTLRCWKRPTSHLGSLEGVAGIEWLSGDLTAPETMPLLVAECDAVVHAGISRSGKAFHGHEDDIPSYAAINVIGTLQLIEAAKETSCNRFVFLSSCAVHEIILDDMPLNESHPLWATSHYGAHKAAIEKFIHSYGFGDQFPICALRPTGVYGLAEPADRSKWFELVSDVIHGKEVSCSGGGKEVHAADVARAVHLLLKAEATQITGQAFNVYDMYISKYDVAFLAKEIAESDSKLAGTACRPKHQIDTTKIRKLGLTLPGESRLRETITEMIDHARKNG